MGAALTRARETVIVVGPESAIRTALQDVQGDVRLTSLHSRLAAAADRAGLERCEGNRACFHLTMKMESSLVSPVQCWMCALSLAGEPLARIPACPLPLLSGVLPTPSCFVPAVFIYVFQSAVQFASCREVSTLISKVHPHQNATNFRMAAL